MQRVVDSYHEYGGKYSGSITHKTRPGALVFQDDELAQVLKALRRGSAKEKALAKKAYKMLTGFERCPECGKLTTHHVYTDRNKEEWWCENASCLSALKMVGVSANQMLFLISQDMNMKNFVLWLVIKAWNCLAMQTSSMEIDSIDI